MKITASRIDEIRRAQAEWDAETERREGIRKEEQGRYRKAVDAVVAPVEREIDEHLRKFNLLDFELNVSPSSSYRGGRGLQVEVRCNQNHVHDETSALSWDWRVNLSDEGEIVKDSGSWSGLTAIDEASMASLKQTVAALEYLNSIDWQNVIDVTTPSYADYLSDMEPRGKTPNFKQQLKEAELEQYIGKDVMLLGHTIPEYESRWNRPVPSWFIIVGETPKQYKVGDISVRQAQYIFEESNSIQEIIEKAKKYTYRIRKDRLQDALEYPYVELNEETVLNR